MDAPVKLVIIPYYNGFNLPLIGRVFAGSGGVLRSATPVGKAGIGGRKRRSYPGPSPGSWLSPVDTVALSFKKAWRPLWWAKGLEWQAQRPWADYLGVVDQSELEVNLRSARLCAPAGSWSSVTQAVAG